MRAARTPPEPPPITTRSTSSAIAAPLLLFVVGCCRAASNPSGDRLAAFFHLVVELGKHVVTELLAPVAHILQARVDRLRLLRLHFLADWRLVEGEHVLELLLGEGGGVES